MQLEYCHNIIVQTNPDPTRVKEYDPTDAMIMARLIDDFNNQVQRAGASFSETLLLDKGNKVFGKKGHDATRKELDQLQCRSCFHPVSMRKIFLTNSPAFWRQCHALQSSTPLRTQ